MDVKPDIRVVVPSNNLSVNGTKVFIFGQELRGLVSQTVTTEFPGPDQPIETVVTLRLVGRRAVIESEDATPSQEDNRMPVFWPFTFGLGR